MSQEAADSEALSEADFVEQLATVWPKQAKFTAKDLAAYDGELASEMREYLAPATRNGFTIVSVKSFGRKLMGLRDKPFLVGDRVLTLRTAAQPESHKGTLRYYVAEGPWP